MYFANADQSQFVGLELRYGNTLILQARRGPNNRASAMFVAPNGGTFNDNQYYRVSVELADKSSI